MTIFEDWPAWVAFVTIIAAYAMGSVATYWTIDRTLVLF